MWAAWRPVFAGKGEWEGLGAEEARGRWAHSLRTGSSGLRRRLVLPASPARPPEAGSPWEPRSVPLPGLRAPGAAPGVPPPADGLIVGGSLSARLSRKAWQTESRAAEVFVVKRDCGPSARRPRGRAGRSAPSVYTCSPRGRRGGGRPGRCGFTAPPPRAGTVLRGPRRSPSSPNHLGSHDVLPEE